MPSLKDLRNRIGSVKSTKKITSAMKMVAAAKLKRAQDNAEKTRPYALKMHEVVESLTSSGVCLLYTSPSPRDATLSRMPSSA